MQSRGLPASPFVPGAQCEHHVLSSGCISLSFGGIVAQFCRRRQCSVFCNTRDCIWKRKIGIGLFEDKSKFLYLLIDAHSDSDCMTFLLSLQKINKFYQLRNSKRRMLLVMEKGFLRPTWHSGIDRRHVGDFQLCSGCNVCLWFVRYSASNKRGHVMLVIMCYIPW